MTYKETVNFFTSNPGYMKWGIAKLSNHLQVSPKTISNAMKDARGRLASQPKVVVDKDKEELLRKYEALKKEIDYLKGDNKSTPKIKSLPKPFLGGDPNNVIAIGDLHSPFILEGYLEFNRELQEKHNCGTVIFLGDVIDAHSWADWDANPDGKSPGDELNAAVDGLKPWYQVFPNAICLLGNHDLRITRRNFKSGLPSRVLKSFEATIEAPLTWEFKDHHIKDGVKYTHGSIGNAFKRACSERMSVVQGHIHSESFVQWSVSEKDALFGLQIGCGMDRKSYAAEYGKDLAKKPIISSGTVKYGKDPQIHIMPL